MAFMGAAAYLGGQGAQKAALQQLQVQDQDQDQRLALQLQRQESQFDQSLAEQKQRDAAAAAASTAETAARNAQTRIAQTNAGIDPDTGKPYSVAPVQLAMPTKGRSTLYDRADQLDAEANEWQGVPGQHGYEVSQSLRQQAAGLRTAAHQADQDALNFQKEADLVAYRNVQAGHWSAQDVERFRHDNATEAIQIRNGQLRYDAAMAGVNVRAQAINAANQRSQAAINAANQRSQAAINAANARFNASQTNRFLPQPPRALPGGAYSVPKYATVGGAGNGSAAPEDNRMSALVAAYKTELQKNPGFDWRADVNSTPTLSPQDKQRIIQAVSQALGPQRATLPGSAAAAPAVAAPPASAPTPAPLPTIPPPQQPAIQ